MIREWVMPAERQVVAAEPVAPVVAHPALLGTPGGRFQRAGIGADAEVAVAQGDRRAAGKRLDRAAAAATRAVHPAVEPVFPAAGGGLVIVRAGTAVERGH